MKLGIDGRTVAFNSESQCDVWVISCVYAQSQRSFTLTLPLEETISPAATNWILIVVVIAVLVVLVAVVVVVRRRRRTAATVASILKENRPVY